MKIGVFSVSLPKLPLREMFAWCAERGIGDVELGVGAWGPWPRPHLDLATIGLAAERDRLRGELREHNLTLSAVNAAGNLLHPDPAKRKDAQTRFRAAVDLAVAFGVKRVVTMSGCPAGAGGGGLGKEAPEVMVCLEMHAGLTVFNAASFEVLTGYVGRNIGLNMDPSHFWWQGIDPLTVVEAFGDRIGWMHGKDTLLYPERIRQHGVLHFAPPNDVSKAPWHFAPV